MNFKILLIVLPALAALTTRVVYAESIELSISENGEESSSTVETAVESKTNIDQSNNADISNNVNVSANTGNNEVEGNNGDTSIQTGDIKAQTTIENENINVNVSDTKTSSPDAVAEISGNGADSINSINALTHTLFESNQTNVVSIINNVFIKADTGHNTGSYSIGDVVIQTGDIKVQTEIINRDVNQSFDPHNSENNIHLSIMGNGVDSVNSIAFSFDDRLNVFARNEADIDNSADHDLNTGLNTEIGNNGSVFISTGDILNEVTVVNEGINISLFNPFVPRGKGPEVPPFEHEIPFEQPVIAAAQVTPSGQNGDGEDGGEENGEEVGGEVTGIALPVTGNYFLFLLTLASLITFLTGWYLRLRAGRSPNFAYAF